jgi:hypothetical protein
MSKLFSSRKFLILVIDFVAALLVLSVGFFVDDKALAQYVLGIWAAIQPLAIGVVVMIGVEDAAALKAGTHPTSFLPGDPRFRG